MSITFSPISCNGLIADAIPSTIRMLKILEPIAFPTAISTSFFLAATMDVTSSGRDVPIETIVNPTRFWLIPKSMAILLAASTVRSPPNAMAAAPPTIHNRLFGFQLGRAPVYLWRLWGAGGLHPPFRTDDGRLVCHVHGGARRTAVSILPSRCRNGASRAR